MNLPGVAELLEVRERHARTVPRYTSYPTVPHWQPDFGEADYRDALADLADDPARDLSVYVHLPFCARRCYYCGCNAVAFHRTEAVDRYLDCLEAEVSRVVEALGPGRPVSWIHWGGGTPNVLNDTQATRVMTLLRRAFAVRPDAEVSVEMDPRVASREQVHHFRSLGFNRLSMGVQDFDPRVQAAIGRLQPESDTVDLVGWAREAGFPSVNLDLVYGLPYQTRESFGRTLRRIVELAPDRVATFSYAHLPEVRRIQQAVDASGLPDVETKLGLFRDTVEHLTGAGYEWIGLDHFARDEDELSRAARERRLARSFMGYTARSAPDLLGFGMSAIGFVAGRFVGNDADLSGYERETASGRLPVVRGHRLTAEDRRRGAVIEHLMCNLEVPLDADGARFGEPLPSLLGADLARLDGLEAEGLVVNTGDGWQVTPLGRFFVRNVAAALDPHLAAPVGGGGGARLPVFSSSV